MEFKTKPVIGEWYQGVDGQNFEVVAIDAEEATIEIQYFDGAVEELDFASWSQLPLQEVDPPEDWSGAMDMMREDFVLDSGISSHESYASPLDTLDIPDGLALDEF